VKLNFVGTVVAIALGAACPVILAQDEGKDQKDDSPGAIDTESAEAKALAKKLHVTANWRPKKSTIDLTYTWKDEPELTDWKWKGADKCEYAKAGPQEENPIAGLEVGVSSSGSAVGLLDGVEFNGDFTIEWTLKALYNAGSSDLVFLVGVHKNEGIGVRFGDQLVRLKSGGISAITKNEPSRDKFALMKINTVKIVRTGDEIQTWLNKVEQPKKKLSKKELDGKIGLLCASNMRIKIQKLTVSGSIAKPTP